MPLDLSNSCLWPEAGRRPEGRGGGTSGRAMAFCLGRPGLNPGTDFGFFSVQNRCQSILNGWQAFSNKV